MCFFLRLSSSVTSAAFWGQGWGSPSSLERVLPSAASHRTRRHSQETERASVLRSERPSGFLVAGAQCCVGEVMTIVRSPSSGLSRCQSKCLRASVKMCAGECVRNRVRSSAESGLFCVSQSVTSKLGAGRWGEGQLLTTSLSPPHSTVGSLLILPVSAPVPLFLYRFLSFFVLPSFPFLHLFFISNLSYNDRSIN